MNANAKSFVPNAGAKAFVPGGGFGGGSSVPPTSAPQQQQQQPPKSKPFYRYTVHASQQVTKPTTDAAPPLLPAAETFSVPQMLNGGRLRASPAGGHPTVEALNEFATQYFQSFMARSDPQRIGFLATTEMLTPATVNYDTLSGYLLPLVVSSRPTQEHTRQLISAWHTLVSEVTQSSNGNVSKIKGLGHIVRQWKQDDDTPSLDSPGTVPVMLHYFFIVLSEPNAIARDSIFSAVQMARQVIPISSILPLAFDGCRTTAAFYFSDEKEGEGDSLAAAIQSESGLSDAVPIEVNGAGKTLDVLAQELGDRLLQVVDEQTHSVTPKSIILKLSSSSSSSSSSVVRTSNGHNQLRFPSLLDGPSLDEGLLSPDAFRLISRICWDYLIIPSCVLVADTSVLEKVKKAATSATTPIRWDEASPAFSLLTCFALRQLLPPTEAASRLNRTAATVPSDAVPTVAKQPELVTVLPISASTGSPFAATCFNPVEDPVSYQVIQDLLLQCDVNGEDSSSRKDENGDSKKSKRLRRSNKQQAGQAISSEAYRLRRTSLGEAVLLVVDSLQNLFVVDSASKSFVATLPAWRNTTTNSPLAWSGTLPPNAGNCVLEATLVPSYRREGQFKIIVEDILMWNSVLLLRDQNLNYTQRMQEVEGSVLEEEHHWCASSPAGVAILRASIFPLTKGPQLLNTFFSEHPTMGITFIPVHNFRGGKPAPATEEQREAEKLFSWTWQSPDSYTFNFLAAAVEDVTEAAYGQSSSGDDKTTTHKINRLTLHCCASVEDDNNKAATSSSAKVTPYNEEYVDYFVSSAPEVNQFSTVQCLMIKEADGAHFWEVVSEYKTDDRAVADSKNFIDSLVNDPCPVSDEVNWLCQAPHHQRASMN